MRRELLDGDVVWSFDNDEVGALVRALRRRERGQEPAPEDAAIEEVLDAFYPRPTFARAALGLWLAFTDLWSQTRRLVRDRSSALGLLWPSHSVRYDRG
jgi:hypothetical protein